MPAPCHTASQCVRSLIPRNAMKTLLAGVGSVLVSTLLLGGLLLGAAGRWDLPLVWAYLGGFLVISLVSILLLSRRSPDLLKLRTGFRFGRSDVPDLLFRGALVLGFLAHYGLAGVDVGR